MRRERILKIGQHLAKLWSRVGRPVFDSHGIWFWVPRPWEGPRSQIFDACRHALSNGSWIASNRNRNRIIVVVTVAYDVSNLVHNLSRGGEVAGGDRHAHIGNSADQDLGIACPLWKVCALPSALLRFAVNDIEWCDVMWVLLIGPCCPVQVVDIDCFAMVCSILLEQINDDNDYDRRTIKSLPRLITYRYLNAQFLTTSKLKDNFSQVIWRILSQGY